MSDPLLSAEGVTKEFPNGTRALGGVDLRLERGVVHGLVGANGAGKSTLIKILSGASPPTAGRIRYLGSEVSWHSPARARRAGISTIYQHLPLVPTLSAFENVVLGETGWGRRSPAMRTRVEELMGEFDIEIDLDRLVSGLGIGERQMVSILQAVVSGAQLIIMDEPTASLSGAQRQTVYGLVRQLAERGNAVLFVSHFLDEIVALTDEVIVLRDGAIVHSAPTSTLTEEGLAALITAGNARARDERRAPRSGGLPVAQISGRGSAEGGAIAIAAGEIVGIAGLLGSGRSELLQSIFGASADPALSVRIGGKEVPRNISAAIRAGIALVPEDRDRCGYLPNLTIAENLALPGLAVSARPLDRVRLVEERTAARIAIEQFGIRARGAGSLVTELSGGNAQKVVFAKWLSHSTNLLLLDEPTAGIDIGARRELMRFVRDRAANGLAVLMVSSDFQELLDSCDRILVMRGGVIAAERRAQDTSEDELILFASTGSIGSKTDAN